MDNRPSIQEPPSPWALVDNPATGGLYHVGFAPGSDLLLVLSSQGRGIFDCLTGDKIARDYDDENDFFDPVKLTAVGFGPLEGIEIRMAGLLGGGLPRSTADDWFLSVRAPSWPLHTVELKQADFEEDGKMIRRPAFVVGDSGACEFRAFGFSETGQTFIIASSCQIDIFAR